MPEASRSAPRTPPGGRVFADAPVHGLAEQVGVPGVPAVLLDQVTEEPAQAGMATVWPGGVDELVEPAVGQGRVELRPGLFDRVVPQCVELFGGVIRGRVEVPVGVGVPGRGVPGGTEWRPAQFGAEHLLLGAREVLEQPAQRQCRDTESGA